MFIFELETLESIEDNFPNLFQFVKTIEKWGREKQLKMDVFLDPVSKQSSDPLQKLSDTQRESYATFSEIKDLEKTCARRGLKSSTIVTHLSEAIKHGLHVDTTLLGLTQEKKHMIEKAIASDKVNSDVLRLAPIKQYCDIKYDTEISWDSIKLTVALLIARYGVEDNKLRWSESDKAAVLSKNAEDSGDLEDGATGSGDLNESSSRNRTLPAADICKKEVMPLERPSAKRQRPICMSSTICDDKEVMRKRMKANSLFKI